MGTQSTWGETPVLYNVETWVEENQKYFLPPVCNKMMHNDQLKVFYVGGPNQRKDFHMEEGEEFFFMRKGNMSLPILTQGGFRTVHIKEGEVFLLPGRIPRSPQREENTVGLVVERDRLKSETDGLRYFMDGSTDVLFERWFYCDDLGSQLKPIIDEYFASDEHKTRQPRVEKVEGSKPAWLSDSVTQVGDPFNLQDWLDSNRRSIRSSGCKALFPPAKFQSDVLVLGLGQGSREVTTPTDTFLWQLEGSAVIRYGSGEEVRLKRDETLLVPGGCHTYSPSPESLTLSCVMSPGNKERP